MALLFAFDFSIRLIVGVTSLDLMVLFASAKPSLDPMLQKSIILFGHP